MFAFLGDEKSPQLRHVGFNRQLVERLRAAAFFQYAQRLSSQCLKILLARRYADVVKKIVGAERIGGIDRVAADAARLAVEQRQAALGAGGERLVVAAGKAVKRRVQKDQGALEAGNGPAEIVIIGRAG